MPDQGTLDLTLAAEPSAAAEARAKVCAAIAPELADGTVETLRLLVSEVVTNAVRHGGSLRPLAVRAHWNAEVRVEVFDHGGGFTPGLREGKLEDPGGFGLFLVGTLADRWGVETNDGTTVWFVLQRR